MPQNTPFHRTPRARARRVRMRARRSFPRYSRFRRWRKDKTIPLSYLPALAVPLGFMFTGDSHMMGWIKAIETQPQNLPREIGNSLAYQTIGFDPNNNSWDYTIPLRNAALIAGGLLIHKFSAPINRKLKNIPFIGKYVSI